MLFRDTAVEIDMAQHDHALTIAAAAEFNQTANYLTCYSKNREFWHERLRANGIPNGKQFVHAAANGMYLKRWKHCKFVKNFVLKMQFEVNAIARIYDEANQNFCPVLPNKKRKLHTAWTRKKHVIEKLAQSAGKAVLRKHGFKHMIGLHDGIIVRNSPMLTSKLLQEMSINCKAITNINYEWHIKKIKPKNIANIPHVFHP